MTVDSIPKDFGALHPYGTHQEQYGYMPTP